MEGGIVTLTWHCNAIHIHIQHSGGFAQYRGHLRGRNIFALPPTEIAATHIHTDRYTYIYVISNRCQEYCYIHAHKYQL